MDNRICLAIDLKSFFASVECTERNLDPLTTNLAVADISRTEKTICLAVTPSLKAYGIPGRARLFEVVQRVKEINARRLQSAPNHTLIGEASNADELKASPEREPAFVSKTGSLKARYRRFSAFLTAIPANAAVPQSTSFDIVSWLNENP